MNTEAEKALNAYTSKIKRTLISKQQIDCEIQKVAKIIDQWYDGKPILMVGLLKGSFIFLSDLCRAVTVPVELCFMKVKSYCGTLSSGSVKITMDLDVDISNFHVIIVEDIIDTGRTLSEVVALLKERNPLSLKVITLLDKPERRAVDFKADIALFTIPDAFVIGYGLDYDESYRTLPYIAEYSAD